MDAMTSLHCKTRTHECSHDGSASHATERSIQASDAQTCIDGPPSFRKTDAGRTRGCAAEPSVHLAPVAHSPPTFVVVRSRSVENSHPMRALLGGAPTGRATLFRTPECRGRFRNKQVERKTCLTAPVAYSKNAMQADSLHRFHVAVSAQARSLISIIPALGRRRWVSKM